MICDSMKELNIPPQIVKMTSKGQLTLPIEFRRTLELEKGNYLLMNRIGKKYILMEKIETSPLDMITEVFGKDVKKKGLTKKDLEKTVEEIREQSIRQHLTLTV